MAVHATSAPHQAVSAILCGSHGGLQNARSIGHRARRHRTQKARQIQQRGRPRKPDQERRRKLPSVRRWHEPRARFAPNRARQERAPPPRHPASDRACWDARRATQRARLSDHLPLHAGHHHHCFRVHATAQKPHRRWRRALAAAIARTAEAMPLRPRFRRGRDQTPTRFAGVVRPIQPRAAPPAARNAHCLRGLRVDGHQLRKKMDIHPELVRVGDT